jgi:hypothetical protein
VFENAGPVTERFLRQALIGVWQARALEEAEGPFFERGQNSTMETLVGAKVAIAVLRYPFPNG